MPVARKIAEFSERSSWIRQMFEEGARLSQTHGRDKIFDFSIGNPNLEPPPEFRQVMEELVRDPTPGLHGYMPNAGYPETRQAVADWPRFSDSRRQESSGTGRPPRGWSCPSQRRSTGRRAAGADRARAAKVRRRIRGSMAKMDGRLAAQ